VQGDFMGCMKYTLGIIIFIAIIVLLLIVGLKMKEVDTEISYDSYYKAMVQQTVRDMVKEEALKPEKK
jgi:hypothetical protein